MMRSLYSGVSGLKNHTVRMDVIGNNIANVNTTGFKKGRVNFQDLISQTLEGAAKPTEDKGGVNPKQVGLGMMVASIDTIMRQGSLQTTGNSTDVAIKGEGFFVLKKGENSFYTRAGSFGVDREFNLVNPANGFKVQGWNSQRDNDGNYYINNSRTIEDIQIPIGEKFEAKATTDIRVKSNLNSASREVINPANPAADEDQQITSIDAYDSQGNVHKVTLTFVKVANNQWQCNAEVSGIQQDTLRFGFGGDEASNAIRLMFDDRGSLLEGEEAVERGIASQGANVIANLTAEVEGAEPLNINLNLGSVGLYDGVTQQQSPSTTKAVSQNGYGMGYLESFNINQSGVVTGVYSNGESREIAQIGLASFVNPGGLEKSGETNFIMTNNSGLPNIGAPETQGKGSLSAGVLEMSNVDIAEEFTDMIVAQRGFQANSRIITTADQMLQELLMLKR